MLNVTVILLIKVALYLYVSDGRLTANHRIGSFKHNLLNVIYCRDSDPLKELVSISGHWKE
jgi:hypothetical protein